MKKVFVGISGGVDSSVSALLLKNSGYEVTGVFIKAWHPDFLPCNWRAEMRDAMRVCAKLEIPFLLCDLEKEYKSEVIDNLISEYSAGRTPNPDVMCNKEIKFGAFLKFAEQNNADYVATGHYSQRIEKNDGYHLTNSIDTEKDQTYFLWTIPQNKLAKILFPIGHLQKHKVRKIAAENNLHTSTKKDSQGLCFIGHVDIKSFLRRYICVKPGDVVDEKGKLIGRHDGAELYTIGERHGFIIDNTKTQSHPYYISSKNLAKNTITISEKDNKNRKVREVFIDKINFINNAEICDKEITARVRYRGDLHPGKLHLREGKYYFVFDKLIEPVSTGQSIVFYQNGECLGGGIMDYVL